MRIVVVGATGNVGSSLVERLSTDDRASSILGIARRAPTISLRGVEWRPADVRRDDLAALFDGADAVVSLAWLISAVEAPRCSLLGQRHRNASRARGGRQGRRAVADLRLVGRGLQP